MSRNLIFTLLLSTVILYVGMYIQQTYYTPQPTPITNKTSTQTEKKDIRIIPISADTPLPIKSIAISTNKYDITLSTKNATITSLKIKNEVASSTPSIELIPLGNKYETFKVGLGYEETELKEDVIYDYRVQQQEKKIVFFRDFINQSNGQTFTLTKTFQFKNNEHLFEIAITLQNKENEILRLGDIAYTFHYGPQLGPVDEVLSTQKSKQISLRKFLSFDGKKRRYINLKDDRVLKKDNLFQWVGISGRYFTMLLLPSSGKYSTIFSKKSEKDLISGSQITLVRSKIQSAATEDIHRIYLGPNSKKLLARYNNKEDNVFGISGANFEKSMPNRWLGFLEGIWRSLLRFLYSLIPNYGVSIIIITIFIRIATYPIIRKSKLNGEKMKLLAPKLQEIKEMYPNDNMKQSQEIMALYKTYGFSPMSSFIPILIQLPVFLSMYRVISESFELFQAPFVGWINDLSSPDALLSFGDFRIPILGWNELHLLPIIMLGTQFISSSIMMKQQRGQNMGSQKLMFILSYVFPFIIFFALYNSPSGLILYWITSNLVTVLSIFDNNKKQVTLTPIKKKENIWKKYLKQGQKGKR